MTNNLSFENFPKICRLCSTEKDNLNLMENSPHLHILKNMTEVKIELDDGLPKNVCYECTNKLHYISCFIDLCIKSQIKLRNILEKHKTEIHPRIEDLDQPFSPVEEESNNDFYKKCDVVKHPLFPTEGVLGIQNHEYLTDVLEKPSTKRQPSDCEVCGEHFSTKTKLNEHKKKKLDCRTKQYRCTICDKGFVTKFKLKLHVRSHTKETPFECKICLKKFRFASNINRHVDVVHKGLKPFKCDICGKDFSRLERKVQHQNVHINKCSYKCQHCGENFKYRTTYRKHEMDHKIKNGEIQDFSEIKCHICKKKFSSKSILIAHIRTHNGDRTFLCSICGRDFLRKSYLDIHFRIHTGEKPFQCKECGKKFKHASSYKTHSLFHTGLRCFKCDICSKTFKQSAHLKSHYTVHNGEKHFLCSICGKAFSQNSNLKVHTRIHTGETPYYCLVCNKGFYDSSSMKKHKKAH